MPPTHTQTQSMHFRQGANGKINYQQAKALALHFCWRERKGHGGVWERRGVVKKWKERRVRKTQMKDIEVDSKKTTERKVERREKMEKMRERG